MMEPDKKIQCDLEQSAGRSLFEINHHEGSPVCSEMFYYKRR
jgi:hypothetical protein